MGRATITGESGEGLYTVSIDLGSEVIASRIATIDSRLAELGTGISQLQSDLSAEQSKVNLLWEAVDNAIAFYANDPNDSALATINERTEAALEGQREKLAIERELAGFLLEQGNLTNTKSRLQQIETNRVQQAWCADYTESASGEVGTHEIKGEGVELVIVPGASAPTAANGLWRNDVAMTAEGTYLNHALLPGWQYHMPTHRTGVLTNIDREQHTGTVTLDVAVSSEQEIDINQFSVLNDVPIEYMTCDSGAFDEGDSVVVQFDNQDWNQPKVIGFRTNPKPCSPERIIIPLELSAFISTPYRIPQTFITKAAMSADNQFTPCVGGNILIPDTGVPRPDGFNFAGEQGNIFTTTANLTPIISSGIIGSNDQHGGIGSYSFSDRHLVVGPLQLINFEPAEAVASELGISSTFGSISITDAITFDLNPSETIIEDFYIERRSISLVTADLEENQDTVECIRTEMAKYFPTVPQTVFIQPSGGGASVEYEFYRWFRVNQFPEHPDYPTTTMQGAALGYRKVRS
ncbi:MAG: hypothetical protein AAF098_15095 [Pseudomonadota bacterium]